MKTEKTRSPEEVAMDIGGAIMESGVGIGTHGDINVRQRIAAEIEAAEWESAYKQLYGAVLLLEAEKEGLASVVCRTCDTLVGGVVAGQSVRWVECGCADSRIVSTDGFIATDDGPVHIDAAISALSELSVALKKLEEAREAMREWFTVVDKYRDDCEAEGIPLAEYDYERFRELSKPVDEAEAKLRALSSLSTEEAK